jgi:hypothetical protein
VNKCGTSRKTIAIELLQARAPPHAVTEDARGVGVEDVAGDIEVFQPDVALQSSRTT